MYEKGQQAISVYILIISLGNNQMSKVDSSR